MKFFSSYTIHKYHNYFEFYSVLVIVLSFELFSIDFKRIKMGLCVYNDALCMAHCEWCIVCGALCMVHCVWCIVFGALSMMHCVWCIVYGALCMVHCVWCIVYGALVLSIVYGA